MTFINFHEGHMTTKIKMKKKTAVVKQGLKSKFQINFTKILPTLVVKYKKHMMALIYTELSAIYVRQTGGYNWIHIFKIWPWMLFWA